MFHSVYELRVKIIKCFHCSRSQNTKGLSDNGCGCGHWTQRGGDEESWIQWNDRRSGTLTEDVRESYREKHILQILLRFLDWKQGKRDCRYPISMISQSVSTRKNGRNCVTRGTKIEIISTSFKKIKTLLTNFIDIISGNHSLR